MASKQEALDGMPDASPIVRINGDQIFDDLSEYNAGDEVTITGVTGVVKKVGEESYKKTGTRPFVQIHVDKIGGVKLR